MLFASGTVLKPNSTCTYQPRNTIPSARNSPGDPPTSPKGERQNEPKQSRMHYTSAALMATQTLRSARSTHPLHEYTHTLLHCTHCIHLLLLLLHTLGFCPCLHTIPNAKAQTLIATLCNRQADTPRFLLWGTRWTLSCSFPTLLRCAGLASLPKVLGCQNEPLYLC